MVNDSFRSKALWIKFRLTDRVYKILFSLIPYRRNRDNFFLYIYRLKSGGYICSPIFSTNAFLNTQRVHSDRIKNKQTENTIKQIKY